MNQYLNLHTIFLIFIVYSFLGWCLEVIFHIYTDKKLINRGFLHGPICPIYGTGSVLMILFLTPLQDNIFYLFVGGFIVATILEYITGYVLEIAFDTKWWDYTNEKFNLKGYVCLRFSIMWGAASVFLMRVLNYKIQEIIYSIPNFMIEPLYNIILVIFVVDVTLTINSLIEFRAILKELKVIKEELSQKLKEKDILLAQRRDKVYMRLKKRHISFLRMYPTLTKGKFSDLIGEIKSRIEERKI